MIPADLTRDELMAAWKRQPWLRRAGIGFARAMSVPLIAKALIFSAYHRRKTQARAQSCAAPFALE